MTITVVISLDKKSELPAVLFRFRPYKQLQRITTVQWANFSMGLITIQQAPPKFSKWTSPYKINKKLAFVHVPFRNKLINLKKIVIN